MKASKEHRSFVSWLRKRYAKKNGVIPGCFFDIPWLESQIANRNKQKKRRKAEHEKEYIEAYREFNKCRLR